MARPRPASQLTLVCTTRRTVISYFVCFRSSWTASALTPVRTACRGLIGYFVSATFGTTECGGSIFWWSMKTKCFL